MEELYQQQPIKNSPGCWKYVLSIHIALLLNLTLYPIRRLYYRNPAAASNTAPLKASYSQFHHSTLLLSEVTFQEVCTSGDNTYHTLVDSINLAPALVGNVVLWKPSPSAIYANYLTHRLLIAAGLPPSVVQFVPGPAPEVVAQALGHRMFAGLHFTGSSAVFRELWKKIGEGVGEGRYRGYPRVVGETGGKNWHVIHESVCDGVSSAPADGLAPLDASSASPIASAAIHSVRSAFEYQGQKCSALSRLYVSRRVWESGFKEKLLSETATLKVGPMSQWDNFVGPVMWVQCL